MVPRLICYLNYHFICWPRNISALRYRILEFVQTRDPILLPLQSMGIFPLAPVEPELDSRFDASLVWIKANLVTFLFEAQYSPWVQNPGKILICCYMIWAFRFQQLSSRIRTYCILSAENFMNLCVISTSYTLTLWWHLCYFIYRVLAAQRFYFLQVSPMSIHKYVLSDTLTLAIISLANPQKGGKLF